MNLLDRLKRESAAALDLVKAVADLVGVEVVVSIVVSHPGTVEDAFTVGEHSLDELEAIIVRLEVDRVECDVTATRVGQNEAPDKPTH